ncbi:MAG: hypothetical protein AAGB12_11625, partial [Pseudomonadota bacterium]
MPGATLGDTRTEIENTYGEPNFCRYGDCIYRVEGPYAFSGGYVSVTYSDDDIATHFKVDDIPGWVTTAGVSTDQLRDFERLRELPEIYPNTARAVWTAGALTPPASN